MATGANKDVLFILSIDTEEEWNWQGPFPEENCSVTNIQRLPEFHGFCRGLGIRPTYFVDYAVAADPQAAKTVKNILEAEDSELGAHLHSWCNPPFFGQTTEAESHLVNLPAEQLEAKLDALIGKLVEEFGVLPKSFRSGRWGVDGKVLQQLRASGIQTDSSVYPFYQNEFFSCQGAPLDSYWPDLNDPLAEGAQRDILELPVSVGFNRSNFARSEKVYRWISESPLRHFRLVGFFWQLKLLRKLYLSPELCSAAEMTGLVDSLLKRDQPVLHMYLHSSSLIEGVTGLIETQDALQEMCSRIQQVIKYLQQKQVNLRFCTISEARDILAARNANEGILK